MDDCWRIIAQLVPFKERIGLRLVCKSFAKILKCKSMWVDIPPQEAIYKYILIICRKGNLIALKWLATHIGINGLDGFDPLYVNALQIACEYGHLAVAQWLTEKFNLTTEDVRSKKIRAFRVACYNGHLLVAVAY